HPPPPAPAPPRPAPRPRPHPPRPPPASPRNHPEPSPCATGPARAPETADGAFAAVGHYRAAGPRRHRPRLPPAVRLEAAVPVGEAARGWSRRQGRAQPCHRPAPTAGEGRRLPSSAGERCTAGGHRAGRPAETPIGDLGLNP